MDWFNFKYFDHFQGDKLRIRQGKKGGERGEDTWERGEDT